MYEFPARMAANCDVRVLPAWPSFASHVPSHVPPTSVANGVQSLRKTAVGEFVSLKGLPKNPQATGLVLVAGLSVPEWMCAATRLSFASVVCAPVKSILKTRAVKNRAVLVLFR